MRPIYLIGYMGCGKTTLGRAVARRVSMPLIDLDEFIEQREGMTVRQIFEKHGEPYFRKAEHDSLLEVSRMDDVIVATGGGTPCQPGLLALMLGSGT
ncbi:MAG: shikimate kinase, partial [Muribaculaceae bacterium]|nr:shikimate kinase [Muribaculaceae bacterium]